MTRREFAVAAAGVTGGSAATLSWIAATDGRVSKAEYADADRAVNMGSLLKPFLATAYLRRGQTPPVVECRGLEQGCWKSDGHGRLKLPEAIAYSCNVYFLQIARELDRAALDLLCLSYGLDPAGREWSPSRLVGLDGGWPQTPRAVVQAFAKWTREGKDSSVGPVLRGMALCARSGTARDCDWACYAKTGTAGCSHQRSGAGDGYAVAVYPLEDPRHALLVMQHNTTGARAARALRPIATNLA